VLAVGMPFSVRAEARKGALAVQTGTTTDVSTPEANIVQEAAASDLLAEAPGVAVPPAAGVPSDGAIAPDSPADQCAAALGWAADAGVRLPAGVGYNCPSTQFPHQGAACWDASPCRGTALIAINMDLLAGASPEYLRHVVTHEVCHILDFEATGTTTETGADACAAAHGAPV